MRIFVGIDLDPALRTRFERFIEGVQGFAPSARWVRAESLHITLKFIGEQTPEQVAAVAKCLQRINGSAFEIRASGYGFFPTAKAPRVFWIGIHAAPQLAELANGIDTALAELGIAPEGRPYSPHLTLARGGTARPSASPNWRKGDGPSAIFSVLEKRLQAMNGTEFGAMTAHEFILYQSHLSPGGSQYMKLQSFPLPK